MSVHAHGGERPGTAAQQAATGDAETQRGLPACIEAVGGLSRSPVACDPAAPRREEVR